MVQIKGQRATSLTFSFLKLVTIEFQFRDKDYSNTFILPDTKPNMFKYYGTNQGLTSDKSKLLISQTCKQRPESQFRVKGHFILPYLKPNMFKYQVSHQRTSRDKFNLHIYQSSDHIN